MGRAHIGVLNINVVLQSFRRLRSYPEPTQKNSQLPFDRQISTILRISRSGAGPSRVGRVALFHLLRYGNIQQSQPILNRLRRKATKDEYDTNSSEPPFWQVVSVVLNARIYRRKVTASHQLSGIMHHATTALVRESAAQINITIRNPNTNAMLINSLIAFFVSASTAAGTGRPASLVSCARMS